MNLNNTSHIGLYMTYKAVNFAKRLFLTGERKTIQIKPNKLKNIADQQIQNKINEGYFQLNDDQLNDLIIKFEGRGSAEDFNFRESKVHRDRYVFRCSKAGLWTGKTSERTVHAV